MQHCRIAALIDCYRLFGRLFGAGVSCRGTSRLLSLALSSRTITPMPMVFLSSVRLHEAARPARRYGLTVATLVATVIAVALPQAQAQTMTSAAPVQIAAADAQAEASRFVQGLGDQAIATLADPSAKGEKAKAVFRQLLNEHFDIQTIGRFVLGRYWNSATDAQRGEYLSLFERMIVEVYAERFNQYSGENFKVTSAQPSGERDMIVLSQIIRPDGAPPVNVSWRVRQKDGRYRIVDVVVENVSMSQTQRSEFASLIESNAGSFDALLNALRQRTAANAR
jgi:phospholipid transport system substrate-binding protein